MSYKKDGGYIYPQGKRVKDVSESTGGMTLRDYFAGQALIPIIQKWGTVNNPEIDAYKVADTMLKERNK